MKKVTLILTSTSNSTKESL